jgi:hypothetical protein
MDFARCDLHVRQIARDGSLPRERSRTVKHLRILALTLLLATTLSTSTPAVANGPDPWPDIRTQAPPCPACK